MKSSVSRVHASIILALFAIYGFVSTAFTARDLGDTADEATYREAGFAYLSRFDFRNNRDHPPLSKWLSSLYPYFSGDHSLFAFRITHVLLYLLGGLAISFFLFRKRSKTTAITFAALYFLCPNTKAMASLHVNDFDVSIFLALTAICLWIGEKGRWIFSAFFFLGCACASKVSALFYLPFAFGAMVWKKRDSKIALGGFVLAILFAYLFYIPGLRWFGSSVVYQFHHNTAGHRAFFLGHSSETGFWDFFLVLFFLKLPLASLILVLAGNLRLLWKYRRFQLENMTFVLPALALFLILSFGKIHIGFRYFLPGLLLLYISAAIGIDDLIARARRRLREFPVLSSLTYAGWGLAMAALFFTDLTILRDDTYLSFFNSLAPNPTRNFADSSIDWGQGIPAHLRPELAPLVMAREFSFIRVFENADPDQSFNLAVGASFLSRVFTEYDGSWLLRHKPSGSVSGNELHEFTPRSLLRYLESPSSPPLCAHPQLTVEKSGLLDPARIYLSVTPGSPEVLSLVHGESPKNPAPGTIFVSEVCKN